MKTTTIIKDNNTIATMFWDGNTKPEIVENTLILQTIYKRLNKENKWMFWKKFVENGTKFTDEFIAEFRKIFDVSTK